MEQQNEQDDDRYRHAEQPEQNRGHRGSSFKMVTFREMQFGIVMKGFKGFRNAWRLCHAGVSWLHVIPAQAGISLQRAPERRDSRFRVNDGLI
jgi:hypothetical protein